MQRGFSPKEILILVGIIVLVGLYVSARNQTALFAPIKQVLTSGNVLDLSTFNKVDKVPNSQIVNLNTPEIALSDQGLIVLQGNFQYSENKIKYTFTFPKKGGEIKGNLEGVCNGTITGNYNGGKENSLIGNFNGSCTAGPILFIKPTFKADFTGDVDQKSGKVQIRYKLTEPITDQGSFEMFFAP